MGSSRRNRVSGKMPIFAKGEDMAIHILTMRIMADPKVSTEQICDEIYRACADVPFAFDITSIQEEDPHTNG